MSKKFDKASVPEEAFAEWAACDERPLSEHFLNGWVIATKAVIKAAGITLTELTSRSDQKAVFGIIKDAARQKVRMSDGTFERYCKIARYCVIYGCPWDVASDANREDLRDCKVRIKAFNVGSDDEKWERAWKERSEYNKIKAEKDKKEHEEWLAEHGSKDEDELAKSKEMFRIPLPVVGQDEDAYWMEYLQYQVSHIQKHMNMLDGDSNAKKVVMNFFAAALPLVKKSKAVKQAEAA